MKLKYIDINGYGVLVDENAEIKEGDFYYLPGMNGIYRCEGDPTELNLERRVGVAKTLFAEKELNLDSVPILPNWRYEFVDNGYRCRECNEKVALGRKCKKGCSMLSENLVIDVIKKPINQTKAKYTEEDLIGLLQVCKESAIIGTTVFIERKAKEYIQSLQKHPKFIEMESEMIKDFSKGKGFGGAGTIDIQTPKLITNSEGKQEGIIKQIIW